MRTNTYIIVILFQVIGAIDPANVQAQCEGVCTSECITSSCTPICCPAGCPGEGDCLCSGEPAACAGSDLTIVEIAAATGSNFANYGSALVGGTCIAAFAAGNTYENSGTTKQLYWVGDPANEQAVLAENMYRLKDDHFEQIGLAWIKHVHSAAGIASETCCAPPTVDIFGIGCRDVYSASLNGLQSSLGPRAMVNAVTGQHGPQGP